MICTRETFKRMQQRERQMERQAQESEWHAQHLQAVAAASVASASAEAAARRAMCMAQHANVAAAVASNGYWYDKRDEQQNSNWQLMWHNDGDDRKSHKQANYLICLMIGISPKVLFGLTRHNGYDLDLQYDSSGLQGDGDSAQTPSLGLWGLSGSEGKRNLDARQADIRDGNIPNRKRPSRAERNQKVHALYGKGTPGQWYDDQAMTQPAGIDSGTCLDAQGHRAFREARRKLEGLVALWLRRAMRRPLGGTDEAPPCVGDNAVPAGWRIECELLEEREAEPEQRRQREAVATHWGIAAPAAPTPLLGPSSLAAGSQQEWGNRKRNQPTAKEVPGRGGEDEERVRRRARSALQLAVAGDVEYRLSHKNTGILKHATGIRREGIGQSQPCLCRCMMRSPRPHGRHDDEYDSEPLERLSESMCRFRSYGSLAGHAAK